MRRIAGFILSATALCACAKPAEREADARSGDKSPSQPVAAPASLSVLELKAKSLFDSQSAAAQQGAKAIARAKTVLAAYLFDPFSAQYRKVRLGRSGAVCGEVNAKNRYGAYVGFREFVIPKGEDSSYTSTTGEGITSELYSDFARNYVDFCATQQEVRAYRILTTPVEPDLEDPEPESDSSGDNLTI